MLNTEPANLYSEIQAAERLRDKHIASMGEQVERFHGPYYKDKGGGFSEFTSENHYYEYVSLMVPRLIYDNPRVRVGTRRPGTQATIAEATKHALNRWVREVGFRKLLTEIATDMVFNFSVVLTTEKVNKGLDTSKATQMPGTPLWPQCSRIPQNRFVVDPIASSLEDARFIGHKWIRDKEDLIHTARTNPESGWNLDVIEELKPTSDRDSLGRTNEDYPDRDEVVCYEIWVPEIQIDEGAGPKDGFHGTIYTIAVDGADEDKEGRTIREPRPYYGPRWGPYTFFGLYRVPSSIYPLSPLVAVEGQIQDLNAHASATSRSAEQYKKLILVDNTDPKFVQRVKDSKDNYVLPVSGLEKQRVVQAEVGGITQQQLSYLELARARLDRNSGITDAQRGNVEGRGTATEVTVAAEAHTVRLAYIKQQFADAVAAVLKTVAWFFYHDDRVAIPLGMEGQKALGIEEPWLVGGDHDPESGATFDDLELEIEPHSMERSTEGTHSRRIMEMYQILMQTAPAIPQMPFVNWSELLERLGDALNIEDLSSLIDVEMAAQMAGAEAMPNDPTQPRFNRDVGDTGPASKARPRTTQASKQPSMPGAQTPDMMPGQVSGIEASNAINFGQ